MKEAKEGGGLGRRRHVVEAVLSVPRAVPDFARGPILRPLRTTSCFGTLRDELGASDQDCS